MSLQFEIVHDTVTLSLKRIEAIGKRPRTAIEGAAKSVVNEILKHLRALQLIQLLQRRAQHGV